MKQKLFFFFSLLSFLSAVGHPDGWFLANSNELDRLETIWKTSEAYRLNWESQARELKNEAEVLKKDSQFLNTQLKTERTITASLKKSFEEFAVAQFRIISQKDGEITRINNDLQQCKVQRNILLSIVVTAVLLVASLILLRIRPP